MQTSEVSITRLVASEKRRPEESSNRDTIARWGRLTVQWVGQAAQWVGQTVQWGQREETPEAATRQSRKTLHSCSSDHLAPVDKHPGLRSIQPRHYNVDLGCSDLAVNYQSPTWHLPQEGIPQPKSQPVLKDDEALSGWFKKPRGLDFIRTQLAKRRQAIQEGKGASFTFEPLMTTLSNIKTFACHIRAGQHFTDGHPLTDSDVRALNWLEQRAEALLNAQAPYELTVHLAFAFLAVYEAMSFRRVAVPQQPDGRSRWYYILRDIEPDEITAYSWGGNNTTGPQCGEEFYDRQGMSVVRTALTFFLHEPHMLIYPSFQPLGIEDFCRFGHLPVHPIGMITDFACNADGFMEGPLWFAIHDCGHMNQLGGISIGESGLAVEEGLAVAVMHSSDHRLVLRQMLLDHTPASLEALKPGLRILQFYLLHEKRPEGAAKLLESDNDAFPRCLEILLRTLRKRRAGYHPDDRNITDSEAAKAALWGARLLCQWRAAGFEPLSKEDLEACASTFKAQDLPLLQEHLDWILQYRGQLRQMFVAGYSTRLQDTEERYCCETESGNIAPRYTSTRMTLFDSFDPYSGLCNMDNIDLAYFVALTSAAGRCAMEQCTGAELPESIVFASDSPQP